MSFLGTAESVPRHAATRDLRLLKAGAPSSRVLATSILLFRVVPPISNLLQSPGSHQRRGHSLPSGSSGAAPGLAPPLEFRLGFCRLVWISAFGTRAGGGRLVLVVEQFLHCHAAGRDFSQNAVPGCCIFEVPLGCSSTMPWRVLQKHAILSSLSRVYASAPTTGFRRMMPCPTEQNTQVGEPSGDRATDRRCCRAR